MESGGDPLCMAPGHSFAEQIQGRENMKQFFRSLYRKIRQATSSDCGANMVEFGC